MRRQKVQRQEDRQLSWQNYFRIVPSLIVSVTTAVLMFPSCAIADEVKSQTEKFAMVKQAYLDAAFGNANQSLVKFYTQSAIRASYKCASQIRLKCKVFGEIISDAFKDAILGARSLPIEFVTQNSRFEFIASDTTSLEGYKVNYTKVFESKYLDASDLECQLYYESDAARNVIIHAAMVVSVESAPRKIIFCIATQFRRALGLAAQGQQTFSEIWNTDPALPKASQQWFELFVHSYTLLDLIHMCTALRPGMNLAEVNAELVPSSTCFKFIERF